MSTIVSYIRLTKPTIISLVAITAVAAMAAEGSLFSDPVSMLLVLMAIVLAAGSANAFNQYLDRDIDAVMDRTKKKRPIPLGDIKPTRALLFALVLGVGSTLFLWWKANALAAIISVLTILFYVFVYTIWLKRRHYYNIVIGGAAGATAPLIAWAAARGELDIYPWILFGIIFMWTPPHFWALALALKDEYRAVKVPMLPVVFGDRRTRIEILLYTIVLLPIVLLPYFFHLAGVIYLVSAILLWVWYLKETIVMLRRQDKASYKKLFAVSIGYLFFLFLAVGLDGAYHFFMGKESYL